MAPKVAFKQRPCLCSWQTPVQKALPGIQWVDHTFFVLFYFTLLFYFILFHFGPQMFINVELNAGFLGNPISQDCHDCNVLVRALETEEDRNLLRLRQAQL